MSKKCTNGECKFDHQMLDPIFEAHEQKKKMGAVLVQYKDHKCIDKLERTAIEKIECGMDDKRRRD